MSYSIQKEVNLSFERAVEETRKALADEGFGILTEIDVQSAMKQKLGIAFEKYVILGACNPPFAHEALQAERAIGLLLPCNVIIYEKKGLTIVAAIRPTTAMSIVENEVLGHIAQEVEERLERVIAAI